MKKLGLLSDDMWKTVTPATMPERVKQFCLPSIQALFLWLLPENDEFNQKKGMGGKSGQYRFELNMKTPGKMTYAGNISPRFEPHRKEDVQTSKTGCFSSDLKVQILR